MSQIAPVVASARDVAEIENVELALTSSTSGIDWEENWHADETADQTHDHTDLKKAEEEVAIERVVLQNGRIWRTEERAEPVEEAIGEAGGTLARKEGNGQQSEAIG